MVSGTKGHRFESCIAHHSGLENKKVGKCDGEPPVCSHFPTLPRAYTEGECFKKHWLEQRCFPYSYPTPSLQHPPFAFLFRIPQISLRAYPPPSDSNFLPAAFFHHQSFHPSERLLHRDFVIPMRGLVASIVQQFGKELSRTNREIYSNRKNREVSQIDNLFSGNYSASSEVEAAGGGKIFMEKHVPPEKTLHFTR